MEHVKEAMSQAFSRHLNDETVEVFDEGGRAILNGGNWTLAAHSEGTFKLDLPANNPNYFDDDLNAFLDNVLSYEAEESFRMLDDALGGAVEQGLRRSREPWGEAMANRIAGSRA